MASNDIFDFFQSDNTNANTNATTTTTTTTTKDKKQLTKEDIIKTMKEYDGSGVGVLTTKQCLAAMREIQTELGMTETECQEHVKLAADVCGDGTGKIKLDLFATHLAFEVRKKQPTTKQSSNINPFLDDDLIETGNSSKPPLGLHLSVGSDEGSPSPSPRGGDTVLTPSDPSAAFTIPDWYGHSLHSPMASDTSTDVWGFDLEIAKKPTDDKTSQPQSAPSLIAPPRSKDQKSPRDKKRAKSPSPRPGTTFSFAVHFADGGDPVVESPAARKTAKEEPKDMGIDLNMLPNMVEKPQSPNENKKSAKQKEKTPTPSTEADKKEDTSAKEKDKDAETEKMKRTDAVAEMKRGTAMLKYGRRGYPHFRRFQLSDDMTRLVWYSRRKNVGETSVAIADIKEVLDGQQTDVFKQCTQTSLEKASFSIVYGNKQKTLDLVAKSYEEAKLWTKGLRGLMKAHQQGKLHKVAQILVHVEYTDITKPNYRGEGGDKKKPVTGYDNTELLHAVETTLEQSKKTFKQMQDLMLNPDIQKHKDFTATKELMSELEQRFDDIEFALSHRTLPLQSLKKDIWVLKVDTTVLHDKLLVLGKTKFGLF